MGDHPAHRHVDLSLPQRAERAQPRRASRRQVAAVPRTCCTSGRGYAGSTTAQCPRALCLAGRARCATCRSLSGRTVARRWGGPGMLGTSGPLGRFSCCTYRFPSTCRTRSYRSARKFSACCLCLSEDVDAVDQPEALLVHASSDVLSSLAKGGHWGNNAKRSQKGENKSRVFSFFGQSPALPYRLATLMSY